MFAKQLSSGTVHKLPSDMRKAILADKKIRTMWEDITPLARNEWICWTVTCAKPETRAKHIVVMRDKMLKGMRRPCCWVGCLHREKTGKV
ncbi:MAG TPA: YdeI/OmpD-associated family protein [Candidatus Saccharimonadales bacterium]|nr:YdeI/OmpD-associated family protein [Candidatus Saccharimonadales bacterium]